MKTDLRTRWEYMRFPNQPLVSDTLNAFGADGWELAAIEPMVPGAREAIYVFKRRVTL